MSISARRALIIAASLCTPFAVQMILIVAVLRTGSQFDAVASYSPYISAAAGFAWLAGEFGIYSLAAAVVYIPAMVITLAGFSLAFGSWLSHDLP